MGIFSKPVLLLLPVISANEHIAGVITQLTDMKQAIQNDANAQEKAWAEFRTWCEHEHASNEESIENFSRQLSGANANLADAESKLVAAQDAFDVSTGLSNDYKSDLNAMRVERDATNGKYRNLANELSQNIAACDEAQAVLSGQAKQVNAASLIQLREQQLSSIKSLKNTKTGEMMTGSGFTALKEIILMQVKPADQDADKVGQAQAKNYAYESSTSNIIQMIKSLKEQLNEQKQDADMQEIQSKGDYENAQTEVTALKEAEDLNIKNKEDIIADMNGAIGQAQKDARGATQSRNLSQKELKSVQSECAWRARDYIAESKAQTGEMKAIDEAVGILQGASVSSAGKVLTPPAEVREVSFLQISTKKPTFFENDLSAQKKLIAMLKEKATSLGSKMLMQVADSASMGDPFGKIKTLVSDLITQLTNEANAERSSQQECALEMQDSDRKIKDAKAKTEKAKISVEMLTSTINESTQNLKELEEAMSEAADNMAQAVSTRADQAAANAQTMTDLEQGATALSEAINVLQDYYNSRSEAASANVPNPDDLTSLAEDKPGFSSAGASYTGNDASTSILALLKQIESDMNVQRSTLQAEDSSEQKSLEKNQSEYQIQNGADKVRATGLKELIASSKGQLIQSETEFDDQGYLLGQLQEYKTGTLDPKCVTTGVSFEEKNAKRREEIESLEDALTILANV